MGAAVQQDRLTTVSTMAAVLADRILMERVNGGPMPISKGEALWIASLALEANEHPVPVIVTEALAQFRPPEAANDVGPVFEPEPSEAARPTGVLSRLLRPFRGAASA